MVDGDSQLNPSYATHLDMNDLILCDSHNTAPNHVMARPQKNFALVLSMRSCRAFGAQT